ncbi:hypothetical protein BS1321_17765 [Peribacillus simplex NBRC 15720 = DSM 1321]|uniref:Uncharacterized protein n=1 Tax=Peribacillus simplex NBRC 15720 = DSM 1321 TaxID=1349754 RepID=A0A223EK43_9BACI|nr:hypothetical protein BS1321_17765 [Peribacillus simplex NBRC 15720 = DSM 1321]
MMGMVSILSEDSISDVENSPVNLDTAHANKKRAHIICALLLFIIGIVDQKDSNSFICSEPGLICLAS